MFMASNVGINDNNDVTERIEVKENDSKTRSKLKEIFNEGDDAANAEKVASKVSNPPFVDSDDSLSSDTNNDDSDDMDYEMEQFYSFNSKDSSSSEGDNFGLIYCTYLLAIES